MSDTPKQNLVLSLFLTFMKIGAFTFGGGYAMIPLIREEVVHKKHWIEDSDILDITAIAESTPGPIAINSATFVGHKVAGFGGALAATLGVTLPSFLIIFAISFVLRQFESLAAVKYAFFGIRAGVLALIVGAMMSMYRQCPKGIFEYVLMAAALACTAFFKVNVLFIIIGCALAGLIRTVISGRLAGTASAGTESPADEPDNRKGGPTA